MHTTRRTVPDLERHRVYRAESVAFNATSLDVAPGAGALIRSVEDLMDSSWWRQTLRHGRRTVTLRRGRSGSGGCWYPASGVIEFGPGAPWWIAAHELAHCAHTWSGFDPAVDRPHGADYRGWMATVTAAMFGVPAAHRLLDAYETANLPVKLPQVRIPARPTAMGAARGVGPIRPPAVA